LGLKGYKEILVSFSVGLLSLGTYLKIIEKYKNSERPSIKSEATPLQGRSEDQNLSLSWGLKDIRAHEAWRIQKGNRDIIVAVIDTGCDVHHPDLKDNIWVNPGESGMDVNGIPKSSNGLDDDGNGFADDVHGWNFVNDNAGVMDDHGHGTHIAGIIGAGSSGVAPRVSLMILKYYDDSTSGEQNLGNTVRAIYYAVDNGARIINYSGGGILRSAQEEAALAWAAHKGVLVVAAAGNEGLNSDFFHFYPADYELPNILSVAALDRAGQLLNVSNFGPSTVDIAAPGKNIHSTLPGGSHGFMTGTSQATAFATGLAALVMAQSPRLRKPSQIIEHLLSHGRKLTALKGRVRSGSILNAAAAVDGADPALIPSQVAATSQ
jgi:subtilisin family serine protease